MTMTLADWNQLRYEDFVNDINLFATYGIDLDKYNFNLADSDQSPRWVHQYCYEALTKYKDETCLNIKLAAVRHIIDMQRAKCPEYKYKFSNAHAFKIIDFYKYLSHVKGNGGTFKLLPWQQFIVGSMFGWVNKQESATGRVLRRFRYADVYVARKNGKSTLACGIALYMLLMDGEVGADVYTTGPTGKQARIVFDDSRKMLRQSVLPQVFDLRMNNDAIYCDALNAKMEYKNSKPDNLDGMNSHLVVLDEIHSFKSPAVYDVMKTSMGSRENPMFFVISTAGTNIGCIGHERFMTDEGILKNLTPAEMSESTFCALYTIDNGDAFNDVQTWHKANPSMRSGARLFGEFKDLADDAAIRPSARPNFLTKYLNVFVQGNDKWLDYDDIRATANNKLKLEDFAGTDVDCYIGVDIGLVDDLSAIGYVFVDKEENITCFTKAFFPIDNLCEATETARSNYTKWHNQKDGSFTLTEGSCCDFDVLEDELVDACRMFNVKSIELDPYNARGTKRNLEKRKLPTNLRGQGKKDLNEPTKLFERLVIDHELTHNGSAVLEWCMINACIFVDRHNLVTVEKENEHSEFKIDCVKAIITALAGFVHREEKTPRYNRGARRLSL
ncbi:phage terminase large subunit-like protein [Aeromonas hydrophila]|uniref:terminase large subunit n=1 Tax=Aeromonas hydrophila TaxID=644 RepID=UPI00216890CD|nr:terminase TerL endonuclease subunit [Aeromonas hydrophila]MCS3766163.1 phage terminase large subunit-like protein [Aeromonas hydrophila]